MLRLAQHERIFAIALGIWLTACGGDGASPAVTTPQVESFSATYGLTAGLVNGAPLVLTTATGTVGMARLVYDAPRAEADFSFAACLTRACRAPGGATTVTAPGLMLKSQAGRRMVFISPPRAPIAVTVTADGLQNGVPFDLDAEGRGAVSFRIIGTVYPFR